MKKNIEYWVDIYGYNGSYQISSIGRVRRHIKKPKKWTYLKLYPEKNGYLRVSLCFDYNRDCVLVHRLVAIYFVDGDNTLEVNHIDGNKSNNNFENLEWVTRSENMIHAHKTGLRNGITKRDKNGKIAKGNRP